MTDYQKFFQRDHFLASVKAAKERKAKWEKDVQKRWSELSNEYNKETEVATY